MQNEGRERERRWRGAREVHGPVIATRGKDFRKFVGTFINSEHLARALS